MYNGSSKLLNVEQAAKYLSLSTSTLAKMRLSGESPKFVKMGRRVAYRQEDLDAWIEQRLKQTT
ncbi:helix-turn-helix domain-containing protein [Pseudovibrio exalbescens]|uniref:helix-turn-helix transcriptional regulator n=1 Tax=Pseudovibrio exalbescens TaxID=197461 RepID=UPI00236616E8|nr:helix-turn-helix domain-containing protein [Pseudovibrio exalbescens]MDD7910589.1 helix-turn-helix domain-containing protein [Pseudovibrio exalbescens]